MTEPSSATAATGTVPIVVMGQLTIDGLAQSSGEDRIEYSGDGPYAAVGAALWRQRVGMVAPAGHDFAVERLRYLDGFGIDLDGVRARPSPAVRYRVIYDEDGERRFEEMSPPSAFEDTAPAMGDIPATYQPLRSVHIAAMPLPTAAHLVESIRSASPDVVLTLDTHEDEIAGKQDVYARLLPSITAFLPSREEVRTWFGFDDPLRALPSLSALGQRLTVIKMGSQGALIHDAEANVTWRVPAYPVQAVDPTGAGDAFCGGFLAGLSLGDDPPLAVRRGVVSASYAVATHGVPKLPPAAGDAADRLGQTSAERLTNGAPDE